MRCYHAKLYRIRCFYKLNFEKATWRPARSITHIAIGTRSAISLRIAAKTRTKYRHAISRRKGKKGNMSLLAEASSLRENKPLHCFHGRYTYTYRLIPCLLRPVGAYLKENGWVRWFYFQSLFRLSWSLRSRSDGRILRPKIMVLSELNKLYYYVL